MSGNLDQMVWRKSEMKHKKSRSMNTEAGGNEWWLKNTDVRQSIEATWVPWNMSCKGAALTLIQGFADLRLSVFFSLSSLHLWLPPVSPGKADRIPPHIAVRANLFLAEMTGTWPWFSCEVQHIILLPVLSFCSRWISVFHFLCAEICQPLTHITSARKR